MSERERVNVLDIRAHNTPCTQLNTLRQKLVSSIRARNKENKHTYGLSVRMQEITFFNGRILLLCNNIFFFFLCICVCVLSSRVKFICFFSSLFMDRISLFVFSTNFSSTILLFYEFRLSFVLSCCRRHQQMFASRLSFVSFR